MFGSLYAMAATVTGVQPAKESIVELKGALVGFTVLWVGLRWYSRRKWYLANDLAREIEGRGGQVVRMRGWPLGRVLKGRLGGMWVLGSIASPYPRTGNANPRYEVANSRMELICLGDFSRLTGPDEPPALRELHQSGDAVTSEVNSQWLKVEVIGGPWLGSVFGDRIKKALTLTERVLQEGSGRYKALPMQEWTVEWKNWWRKEVKVKRVEPAAQGRAA